MLSKITWDIRETQEYYEEELIKPLEIANISGDYDKQICDWEWLCRSCHMKSDGIIYNLRQFRKWS